MSPNSATSLLVVEDNPGDARLLREMLNELGPQNTQITYAECMSEAEKHLRTHTVDIVLLDPGLPDAQGLEAVRRAQAAAPHVPLVVLTGLDDESLATGSYKKALRTTSSKARSRLAVYSGLYAMPSSARSWKKRC